MYLQVISIICTALGAILSLLTIHFIIFAIVGIFAKKKYPKTDKKLKYGLIIPARNEEKVVGNLIKSIQKNEYPQDKLQIFVIAHNCTDRTAELARALGATVYEYNNPDERTMGYAFRHLFKCIERDYKIASYDGFFLFNADNVLAEDYIDKMNDAFVACDCKNIITSCRNSKNFGSNVISSLYGVYFLQGCIYEARGRTVCGCSTRVQGTGYVVSSEMVKDGWKYVTLTEDWEFSADQVIHGNKIYYCDEAMFYDEQPTTFKIMWRQRVRWCKGHLLVFLQKGRHIFSSIFKPKNKHRVSTYDNFVNTMPLIVIGVCIALIKIVLYAFLPLFDANYMQIWLNELISFGWGLLTSYITISLSTLLIFILERKRIPKDMTFGKKVVACLMYPFFLLIAIPMEILVCFKKIEWKEIPHKDTTTMEKLSEWKVSKKKTSVKAKDAKKSTEPVEKVEI